MSETEPGAQGRREKMVMGLGILAILLLSANITAVVARHFWPNMPIFGQASESMAIAEFHVLPDLMEVRAPHSPHAPHAVHEIRIHRSHAPLTWEFDTDQLERDMRKLQAKIEIETN